LLLAAGLGANVAAQELPPAPADGEAGRPGVVFVIGGVGGWDPLPLSAKLVLPCRGVKHKIVEFVWTHGWGRIFSDLQDAPHLMRKADELAELIAKFKTVYPDRPVYLLAKSGGAGVALAAAERLAPQTIERIVLLSAAVSPGYDLRAALRATRTEIVSFYSTLDRFILGWGTGRFGTIDGVYGPGAGMSGFETPAGLTPAEQALYARLVEVHWHPRMLLSGYAGFHSCNSLPLFVAVHVAPWLR
jgi:hypothetical protein